MPFATGDKVQLKPKRARRPKAYDNRVRTRCRFKANSERQLEDAERAREFSLNLLVTVQAFR